MQSTWSDLQPPVLEILDLLNAKETRLPLVHSRRANPAVSERLEKARLGEWFPGSASPEGALAGLWLLAGGWDRAHEIAQDLHTADGSYWHAIIHRQEPDAWNSGYWFRRVGTHPIFPDLLHQSKQLAHSEPEVEWPCLDRWDSIAFVEFCELARRRKGPFESLAIEIQKAEWDLLFGWCVRT